MNIRWAHVHGFRAEPANPELMKADIDAAIAAGIPVLRHRLAPPSY